MTVLEARFAERPSREAAAKGSNPARGRIRTADSRLSQLWPLALCRNTGIEPVTVRITVVRSYPSELISRWRCCLQPFGTHLAMIGLGAPAGVYRTRSAEQPWADNSVWRTRRRVLSLSTDERIWSPGVDSNQRHPRSIRGTLARLSYTQWLPIDLWRGVWDLNPHPPDRQSGALRQLS